MLVVLCLASVTRAQNEIVVDPNASVRTLDGKFNAIKVSGGIDLYLSQSDNIAIAVSAANDNLKAGILAGIVFPVLLLLGIFLCRKSAKPDLI